MTDIDQNKAAGSSYWDDVHRALSPGNDGKFLPKFELPWRAGNEALVRWSWALELAFVAVVTLLAFWLRFFDIASVPLGIHGDEALFGIDALNFISGEHRGIWTGSALGHPMGYSWLVALSFTVGETNVTWLRMVSVLSGTMLVPAGYMLVRQVIGRDVALLSAIMIATSSWLIFQSRIAYQMILVVFVMTLSMYLIFEAVKRRDIVIALLGGVVFGAGLYTFKAYLIFFAAMTGLILLLTYLPTELRKRRETYLFLIGSFLISAPLLIFYVEEFEWLVENYTGFYLNSNALGFSDLLSRSAEVLLLVKNPIPDGGADGVPSASLLLNFFAQVAFFVGVATIIVFIKHRPYQLVVLAFLVAMAPAVLVPEAESRRFLLGIMLLLIIASIGVRSFVVAAWVVTSKFLSDTDTSDANNRVKGGRTFVTIASVIVIPFLVLYVIDSRQHFEDWRNSKGGLDWYFEPEYFGALKMIDELDEDYRVVSFSGRRHSNDHRIEFLFPNLETIEGAAEHGGPGAVTREMADGNTAFILFGDYSRLTEDLEQVFPNQTKIVRYSDDFGRPHRHHWYTAYLVRDD